MGPGVWIARQFLIGFLVWPIFWLLLRRFFAFNLGQDFADFQRVLDAFVDLELQSRRVASFNPSGNFTLKKSGCILKPAKAQLLIGVAAHDADLDGGLAHVRADLDTHHGDITNPGIAKFRQDGRCDDFADRFGGFELAAAGQEKKGFGFKKND